jgi:hypothetical protein
VTPEISEFSYGFALTNELVGWTALKAAPVFPSLIEEGKKGGGYDVKLDAPGKPLFLQFKRAHCMKRRSAKEISAYGLDLEPWFYRFAITERKVSFQHTSLYELDDGSNLVFYVAPRFHTLDEINSAWEQQRVAQRSIFVSPREIGLIDDDEAHTVSYDLWRTYFCSEPREIKALTVADLQQRIRGKLDADQRPVRAQLGEWLGELESTRARAQQTQLEVERRIRERKEGPAREVTGDEAVGFAPDYEIAGTFVQSRSPPPLPEMNLRVPKALDPERSMLRLLSDEARRSFNAQLLIVQPD